MPFGFEDKFICESAQTTKRTLVLPTKLVDFLNTPFIYNFHATINAYLKQSKTLNYLLNKANKQTKIKNNNLN